MALNLLAPGAYARTAGGNLERPDIQRGVIDWMAWSINPDNGGNGDPAVWNKCRALWKGAGIADFPWLHCRSLADVQRLCEVGQAEGSPAIGLNIEDVVKDGLDLEKVAEVVYGYWVNPGGRPVHMATLPWVQNAQGWKHMSFAVAALEIFKGSSIFPSVPPSQKIIQDCIDHAQAEGLTKVTLMLDTKQYNPADYGPMFSLCHSLYTADDINPDAPSWLKWKAPSPCTPIVPPDVPLTPSEKKVFREQLRRFCLVAQKYDHLWHYTQQRPYTGLGAPASDTHYNDCSSYVAIAFHKAGRNAAVRVDDPLGYHYAGWGNTGSCYTEMKKYPAPVDKYRIGDVALYLDSGGPGDHMTVCIKAGTGATSVWSSFGTEAGPDERSLHYRADLTGVYRPEDLR